MVRRPAGGTHLHQGRARDSQGRRRAGLGSGVRRRPPCLEGGGAVVAGVGDGGRSSDRVAGRRHSRRGSDDDAGRGRPARRVPARPVARRHPGRRRRRSGRAARCVADRPAHRLPVRGGPAALAVRPRPRRRGVTAVRGQGVDGRAAPARHRQHRHPPARTGRQRRRLAAPAAPDRRAVCDRCAHASRRQAVGVRLQRPRRALVSAGMDEVFAAFCDAGLWPRPGRSMTARLAAAGITSPGAVSLDALTKVEGLGGPKRAEKLAKTFVEAQPRYAVVELLHAAGLPVRHAFAAVDQLGSSAAATLRDDPWRLLGSGGLGPRDADVFALRTLADRPGKDDPRRGRAFAAHVLSRAARDGHTVRDGETVAAALAGVGVPDPATAIAAAVDDGVVTEFPSHPLVVTTADRDPSPESVTTPEPATVVGLTRYAMAEDAVAEGLARLLATAQPIATPEGTTSVTGGLDPAQRDAVQQLAAHGVVVLHGGPGTGKSRTVAAVVELAAARHKRIALAAPTGRAAKRLEELTGHDASTLHRLLGAQAPATGDGWTGTPEFLHGESWPLDAEIVVVDESSMLDVELAAALVEACADGTHLLLVGDPAQLPSIGPGRVLADVLESGAVPAVELTTLHRQAEGGTIARLAAAVRGGDLPPVEDPTREVVVVNAASSDEASRRVLQLVTDSIPRALGIPSAEVQVVTPVHRGPAGTMALNKALKQRLNPGDGTVSGFDVGDRVVATANHLDDGFANGEVGVVVTAAEGTLTIDFGAGPVTVPAKAIGDLVHGWAITVHRAQGSEWPAVVSVLTPEAGGMLSRPLVYTAWTRAQRHLSVVHAAGAALARGVREVGARPRRTRLTGLLRGDD